MNFSLSLKRDDIERIKELALCAFLVCMALLLVESPAFASSGGGSGGLPWKSALGTIRDSISGSVAMAVSLIAIVASGVMLVFGGDMQGFMKTAAYIALVVGLIVAANNILTTLYPQSANISFLG